MPESNHTPAPIGADLWPTDIRTLLPLAARLLEQYAGFMEGDRRPMTADEARGLAAALASAAQDGVAYRAASSLATALFERHFRHEPHYASGRIVWGLCDTTEGVISQIDNMVSGLVKPAPAPAGVAGLREWREALEEALYVMRSVSMSRDRRVVREGCVLYLQTEEWCWWLEHEVGPMIAALLAAEMPVNQRTDPRALLQAVEDALDKADALIRADNGHWLSMPERIADLAAKAQQAAPTPAAQGDALQLDAVRQAIRDYHFALDLRRHGGVAADAALSAIESVLGMGWKQGAEAAARAAKEGAQP